MTTACMSRSWKVEGCRKKKNSLKEMINHQSAARKGARQVRSNTNLFVRYAPTRPLALDRQTTTATESGTTATTKHAIHTPLFLQRVFSRGKITPNDAIPGRMHATGFFRGYCLHANDLRVAQLNNRRKNVFLLVFCVEN